MEKIKLNEAEKAIVKVQMAIVVLSEFSIDYTINPATSHDSYVKTLKKLNDICESGNLILRQRRVTLDSLKTKLDPKFKGYLEDFLVETGQEIYETIVELHTDYNEIKEEVFMHVPAIAYSLNLNSSVKHVEKGLIYSTRLFISKRYKENIFRQYLMSALKDNHSPTSDIARSLFNDINKN